jgi:hypothetical protein
MANLQADCIRLLSFAPAIEAMRGRPEYKNWGNVLQSFAGQPEMIPLRKLLEETIEDGLISLEPLNRFLRMEAKNVPMKTYFHAAETAIKNVEHFPHASLIISIYSLMGWTQLLGNTLGEQYNGMPHQGWAIIPYACGLSCHKLKSIEIGLNIVNESIGMLRAAKYYYHPRLKEALNDYMELAAKLHSRHEISIVNLVDELRNSCRKKEPNFRAEFGALLWTLGYIPESALLHASMKDDFVPSRELVNRVVRESMDCIPHDPLVQYIWLELKDRPPFNIREHHDLFPIINTRYGQFQMDEFSPYSQSPSQCYAVNLIRWFKGDSSAETAREYLNQYDIISSMYPQVDWVLYLRWNGLAYMLAEKHGFLNAGMTDEKIVEQWYNLSSLSRSVREKNNQHPEWPEIYNRSNLPYFQLIEREFSRSLKNGNTWKHDAERVLETVESFRASALSYWLRIVPPMPTEEEDVNLNDWLETEKESLTFFRGAYFLTLAPVLPHHYRRFGIGFDEMIKFQKSGKLKSLLDPDQGRKQYKELDEELKQLYEQMPKTDGEYARKRLEPAAKIRSLVEALNNHTGKTVN